MLITVDQFKRCFPRADNPDVWIEALNRLLPKYGIDSEVLLIHFLAQCGHESGGFTRLVENLNYSGDGLAATWPNRYSSGVEADGKRIPNALAMRLHRNPEAIGNNVYAQRLGNGDEASGDGFRFRGHGLLQLTGRDVVTAFGTYIDLGVNDALEYLTSYAGAVEGSCYFWTVYKKLTPIAVTGSVKALTKAINGQYNGLAERYEMTAKVEEVLKA